MKRRIIALLIGAALVTLVIPAAVFSIESTVSCTVSAYLVSLSVDDGSVDYGVLALGQNRNTALYDATDNMDGMDTPQTQTITNTGTVAEEIRLKTSNAIGTANWTLNWTYGEDLFQSEYDLDTSQYSGSELLPLGWLPFLAADTYALSWAGLDVPPGAVRYLELRITMPVSVTDYGIHNITVTVEALAA
jgi:hypothetical protein